MSSPLPANKTLKSTLKDTPGAGSSKGFATTTGNGEESRTELLMALTGALNSINAAGGKAPHLVSAMEDIAAYIGKQFQVGIATYALYPVQLLTCYYVCIGCYRHYQDGRPAEAGGGAAGGQGQDTE